MNQIKPCNNVTEAVTKYAHQVQSLAYLYLKNVQDAQDAAQDAFIAYYQKAPTFDTEKAEKAWLMKTTANRCKSMLRFAYRKDVALTEDLSYLPKEENNVLQAVLNLDEKYRVAVHLHYYEGYSLEEIARIMHTKSGTVASWLSRARAKLKIQLEEDYFG